MTNDQKLRLRSTVRSVKANGWSGIQISRLIYSIVRSDPAFQHASPPILSSPDFRRLLQEEGLSELSRDELSDPEYT
jgi:hypothetical protein